MLNSGESERRAGREEREKKKAQRWQERFARGRAGLSASVDEALADPILQAAVDDDEDEANELVESEKDRAVASSSLLIPPRLSLQSKQLPSVRLASQAVGIVVPSTEMPAALSTGAVVTPTKKKRLAGRSTRVELQAVPKQEQLEKKVASKTTPPIEKRERAEQEQPAQTREKLSGSGVSAQGLSEVIVKNSHSSASSVGLVSLLSDPGPVVVKYYTLLPGYGFTLHLSAPVESETRFNYAILLGELL